MLFTLRVIHIHIFVLLYSHIHIITRMSEKTENSFEKLCKQIPINYLIDLIGSGELYKLNYRKMDDEFKCDILKKLRKVRTSSSEVDMIISDENFYPDKYIKLKYVSKCEIFEHLRKDVTKYLDDIRRKEHGKRVIKSLCESFL